MFQISGRGYIFIGLNAIRALSIVSIILVFCSSIFVMVNNVKTFNAFEADGPSEEDMEGCDYISGSSVPNQAAGIFWSVVSSLFLICQSIVLFLSEIEWPAPFFDKFFPVLGSQFGLGALGIFQALMGAQILSHHVDDFTLVSAFFIFSLGCVNMLLGLIFREKAKQKRSITSFKEESKSILPTMGSKGKERPPISQPTPQFLTSMLTGSTQADSTHRSVSGHTYNSSIASLPEKGSLGFGRQGEKEAGLRGYILQRPAESLPRYAAPTPAPAPPPPAFPDVVSFPAPSQEQDTQAPRAGPSNESLAPRDSNIVRSKSLRTTISSFSSPYRKSTQSRYTDDESMYAPSTADLEEYPVPRAPFTTAGRVYSDAPPSFKSSKTSL